MTSPIRGVYAILDPRFLPPHGDAIRYARELLAGGCRLLQLRVKGDAARRDALAREISLLRRVYDFCFIMNDDLDCAQRHEANGVHIGKDDGDLADVRRRVGSGMLIGYSAHDLDEAVAAADAGADYVAFGAIFPTTTKGPGHPVQGTDRLAAVVDRVRAPIVAIGGITRTNVTAVWRTGVAAVAMITGLSTSPDPRQEMQWQLALSAPFISTRTH